MINFMVNGIKEYSFYSRSVNLLLMFLFFIQFCAQGFLLSRDEIVPRLVMIIHSLVGLACDDSTQVNLISGRFVHSCKLLLIIHNDGEDC